MAAPDRFNRKVEAGFVRSYDAQAARQQFNVSLMLVFIIALSALALGAVIHIDAASNASDTYRQNINFGHIAADAVKNQT